MTILHTISFFFYTYCSHRDLHSFPTRRSSDLVLRTLRLLRSPASRASRSVVSARRVARKSRRVAATRHHAARDGRDPDSTRSEEHTSELQSQSNLVCRLLLEKKKQNI